MKLMKTALFAAAAIVGSVAMSSAPVFAQSTTGSPNADNSAHSGSSSTSPQPNASRPDNAAPNAQSAPQAQVDDATLKQVARAFVKVRRISQSERNVLNGSGDQAAKEKAAQQAESEKIAAVKAEGLQPEQYDRVLQIVEADNSVQQRFLSYVRQVNNS